MSHTVGCGKLARTMLSNNRLPHDVRTALITLKQQVRTNQALSVYENRDGGLPAAAVGQTYYEFQVGQAHPGDSQPRGKRRLVALVDTRRNILRVYFSDAHYQLGAWQQLQYP